MGGIPPPPPRPPPPCPLCVPGARWGVVLSGSGPSLSGSSLRLRLSFQSPVRFTPLGAAASSRSVAHPTTPDATIAPTSALHNMEDGTDRIMISRVDLLEEASRLRLYA